MLSGEPPVVNGDGNITRDFTFVDNNVRANILALKSDKIGRGEIINIACGQSISLNQLVAEINSCLATEIKPVYGPERPGDIKHSLADISLSKKLLNYIPEVDFKAGIKKTIDYFADLIPKNR